MNLVRRMEHTCSGSLQSEGGRNYDTRGDKTEGAAGWDDTDGKTILGFVGGGSFAEELNTKR